MPIEPVDPSKKPGGNGNEKYTPEEKRGPGKFDEDLEKAKSDRAKAEISKMSEKTRSEPKYTGKAYSDTGPKVGPRTSGGFGVGTGGGASGSDMSFMKGIGNKPNPTYKSGGKVKSASSRADGCCVKGKTKA
jgi:hypothetical protein